MKLFLYSILTFVMPYKSMDFYGDNLRIAEQIVLEHHAKCVQLIYLAMFSAIYFVLQQLYLFASPPTAFGQFVHADILGMMYRDRAINLCICLLALLSINFHRSFYFKANLRVIYVYKILMTGDATTFVINPTFGNVPIKQLVQRVALRIVNSLQIFVILLDIFLVISIGMFAMRAVEYLGYLLTTPVGLLCLLYHLFNVCMIIVFLQSFTHVLILVSSLGITGMCGLYIRCIQNLHFLSKSVHPHKQWRNLNSFIHNDVDSFELVALANGTFAQFLVNFLLVSIPISAYLVMALLLDEIDRAGQLFIEFVFTHELFGTLVMHLFIAYYTKILYKSVKPLFRLMARPGPRPLRSSLRLLLTIQRLHTKKKLGITYGSIGLVTLVNFGKCILLYCEFLMYAYKIIKNIS